MRTILVAGALAAPVAALAAAQVPGPPGALLERMAGRWVLQGTVAGKATTQDVVASSVLNGQYLQLHEISREHDAQGRPKYEALVYLTWVQARGEYTCLWLDSTSNAGISNGVTCRAKPTGDEIRLVFNYPDGTTFHTTFGYNRAADTWQWKLDGEEEGKLAPFARMTMRRK